MSRKDTFHDIVRHALEKDGWTITHDPLLLFYELGKLYVDLGAEKFLAAERQNQKIAIEVKSFVQPSAISEFHKALGQYLTYRSLLQEQYPEHHLYLAVPTDAYASIFATKVVQKTINEQNLKLIIYQPNQEAIAQWID
ncbi:MAG: fatty-acid oxidation protein subunit alpha [Spirulina sp. SIO3F2]|nr:fatty-acid oxidation protein subunit alpha [Spirulina sp. SIO3F2]